MNVASLGVGVGAGGSVGAGAATIVASLAGVPDAGGVGGVIPRSVIFGSTTVSLPVGRAGGLSAALESAGGCARCSSRAPQFPQKRSSALTSLWQFGHCAMRALPIVSLHEYVMRPGKAHDA